MKLSLVVLPLLSVAAAFGGYGDPIPAPDSVCPANISSVLAAHPWAFQLRTGAVAPRERKIIMVDELQRTPEIQANIPGLALIGTFLVTGPGTISATVTTSTAGVIVRRATTTGRYILYGDCSGGEIMIMLNGLAVQLEFVWSNNFTQMLFVSETMNLRDSGAVVLTGNALPAPAACAAGVAPLNLLNNSKWSFRLAQQYVYAPGDSSVGSFKGFLSAGAGLLTATETTTTASGLVTRLAPESGRYQVYNDCSGGEIMLMNRAPGAVQLEFVFVGSSFNEMFLLSDSAARPADVALGGNAYRY